MWMNLVHFAFLFWSILLTEFMESWERIEESVYHKTRTVGECIQPESNETFDMGRQQLNQVTSYLDAYIYIYIIYIIYVYVIVIPWA